MDLAKSMVQQSRIYVRDEIRDLLMQHDARQSFKQDMESQQRTSIDGSEGHRSISSEQSDGSLSPSVVSSSSVTSGGHPLPRARPGVEPSRRQEFAKWCTGFFKFK